MQVGTILVVWMKKGDWWTEMRRGALLKVTEILDDGKQIRVKEKYDIMRGDNGWVMSVEPAKDGKFNLRTVSGMQRGLVVKLQEEKPPQG